MGEVRRLVLASGSPRRRELLHAQGFVFEIDVPEVDEQPLDGETPEAQVERLAQAKARAVHSRRDRDDLHEPYAVLAADTLVAIDARVLGKPTDRDDAVAMLRALGGRTHRVLTGSTILCTDRDDVYQRIDVSYVEMLPIPEDRARRYVDTGEPLDKAGAYALQGEGSRFVSSVRGSRSNVIGLPVEALVGPLAALGVRPRT